jgi:hypothetical protein
MLVFCSFCLFIRILVNFYSLWFTAGPPNVSCSLGSLLKNIISVNLVREKFPAEEGKKYTNFQPRKKMKK